MTLPLDPHARDAEEAEIDHAGVRVRRRGGLLRLSDAVSVVVLLRLPGARGG